jgi:hypothetical protein
MTATAPVYSPYGGFSDGDHVTRSGSEIHLVKDMTDDGFSATFVCVVAPDSGWIQVGEEEHNLCRRYSRVINDEASGEWVSAPGEPEWKFPDPADLLRRLAASVVREMSHLAVETIFSANGGAAFARAWSDHLKRRARSRAYYRRQPKRRALRK